jgi:hypothetical protein
MSDRLPITTTFGTLVVFLFDGIVVLDTLAILRP